MHFNSAPQFNLHKTPQLTFNTIKYLLVLVFLVCFIPVNAQTKYESVSFRIDSFANVGLPKSALKEVDKLEALARQNKNAPQQIRAVIYRMTFQSYLEENALVAIINRLKTDIDQAAYPVKPVLQSLLAEIYWKYYEQNRYQFSQRTRLDKADSDFTNWDLQTLITETSRMYDLSLKDFAREQNTPIAVLDGVLEGDKSTRYLRPTLYDLLVQRAFDFFLAEEPGLTKPRLPFSLNDPRFFSDSRTFAGLVIKTTDTASTAYKGIRYLQQATAFHLQKNQEEALADIDLQRLKFLYGKSDVQHKGSLYLAALKQIAASFSAKPISSEAFVLQGQYYQGLDSLAMAHSLFRKAVTAYPQSLGGKNGTILIKQIEEKELSATVEDVNVPGKPILALLNYKNLTSASVAVYRLTTEQLKILADKNGDNEDITVTPSDKVLKLLTRLKPVQEQQLQLPDPKDYRKHSAEFRIDALPVGTYIILVKDALSNNGNLIQLTNFRVTQLAYTARINPDGQTELRILNRDSGLPLQGVGISIYKWDYDNKSKSANKNEVFVGLSNAAGKYLYNAGQQQYSIALTLKGDTYIDEAKSFYGVTGAYESDKAQISTVLFTDRQLYRPGQTIYFKGLHIITQNGKSKILPNGDISVSFKDINNKAFSTVDLKCNEFGSIQGSFIIPQNIANGLVSIAAGDGSVFVNVEEYKRPTFQVEFLPVTTVYRVNDSVKLKGKVTAFSGYGISQARLAYHIIRGPRFRPEDYYNNARRNIRPFFPSTAEIKTDTILTNDQGEFVLNFKAVPDENELNNRTYDYVINADVTDASGETRSANITVMVSDDPLQITVSIPDKLLPADTASIPIKLDNLYNRVQKGIIGIKIYALTGPAQVFKTRLWNSPDQYVLSEEAFKNAFPAFAWKKEDDYSTWHKGRKIMDLTINTDTGVEGRLDISALKKQVSGIFEVVINGRDDAGDTTSIIRYVTLIVEPSRPQKMEDWVIPLVTNVKVNGNAEFLVGMGKPANVLMEKYDGSKLLSSEWLTLDGAYQRKIIIPVPTTEKNSFSVQFLMVNDNRVYHYYEKIKVIDTVKKLNIRFLTFRDKLQPGEKEQWKLQITSTGNEKPATEMLAALYDASLDDIMQPQYWRTDFTGEPYGPNYFQWADQELSKQNVTSAYKEDEADYSLYELNYEQLYLFGYDYYGGDNSNYNTYLEKVNDYEKAAKSDKAIAGKYLKNAALVKTGYDIIGRVISNFGGNGLPGVKIGIKNTNISTLSNSSGYFKIKVPPKGILTFTIKQYHAKQINTKAGGSLLVVLNDVRFDRRSTPHPGFKSKGDQVADVTIDEPVGSSGVRVVRFPPPVVKPDMAMNGIYGYSSSQKALQGRASGIAVYKSVAPGGGNAVFVRGVSQYTPKTITIRKNFNETAFFYPQLRTNEKGEILIEFTIPEALTRWKFRAFAHTQDLATGYIENTVITQKQLSISANMPRFLREGDTVTVSARLANLTAGVLKGSVKMQLFNALNMQPVSLFVNMADRDQKFEVAGATNKAISFKLVIPAGLDALTYRLTADAGQFTDGEENTLPVLPNRMLVTESMPMMVRAGQTRSFTFDKLVNQSSATLRNKTLTLEYTQNPAWYAVQALPYLMEFPYECSEQIFSRYYANSLATGIVNKLPAIKQMFDQWKSSNSAELLSNLEKNQELKATLIEETPWLKDAVSESEQKKRIALLFDLNKMGDELKLNLDKLQKRQLPDGGFTWFGGDLADRFITQHIVEGIGELNHIGITGNGQDLQPIADKAITYLDNQLINDDKLVKKNKDYVTRQLNDIEIEAWFARSYFLNNPMNGDMKRLQADYLNRAADQWTSRNVYEQGMIALTMQRYKKPVVTAAIEKSLLETAQQSDELGMYWAKNQLGYFWYESPVETQSLLIELFTEAGNNEKAVDEMKIWLLRNKQTNNWRTTKATAAACYALLLKGGDILSAAGGSVIKLDGKTLEELKPDVKADAGTGYIKTSWIDGEVKPALGKVEIKNNSTNISWGAMHWQYLENLEKITSSQTNIHLERKYFIQKQTDAGPVLTAVDDLHQPKTGDLLKVVVYLKADRDFEYVQLKDMRPSGTEPVDALSAYKYQDGLYYYQVTKDVATDFFISYLNKGNYVFEYQLRVAQPGNFSTGITSIQCMYAPEFNAHSQGGRVTIKP